MKTRLDILFLIYVAAAVLTVWPVHCVWSDSAPVALSVVNGEKGKEEVVRTYTAKLRGKIQSRWRPSPGCTGMAKVGFDIKENGELSGLVLETSSGNETFDQSAIDSIKYCAPFSRSPQANGLKVQALFDGNQVVQIAPPPVAPQLAQQQQQQQPPPPPPFQQQPTFQQQQLFGQQPLTGAVDATGAQTAANQTGSTPLQGYATDEGERMAYDPKIAQIAANANIPMTQPFQMQATQDAKGTPTIPQWKLNAGYDALLGRFFVGFIPVDHPPLPVVLVSQRIERMWRGAKPLPCHLRLFKLADGSDGYYFVCVETRYGPCGWLMPQPKQGASVREWAVYFAQSNMSSN